MITSEAMSSAPNASPSAFPLSRRTHSQRRASPQFHLLCLNSQSNPAFQKDSYHRNNRSSGDGSSHVILVERYSNGATKRFILDEESRVKALLEQHADVTDALQAPSSTTALNWLIDNTRDFILPAGFPGSVSDDYLKYMLWQFPTNITGWICHALVTSSLLKAVGVGSFSGTSAAASAAAIRWVTKDGIGAIGRLLIGGRFGSLFDEDPKQWRMYADFIGSAGSIFDLSTQLYPSYFLALASLGNLAKAVARGLKDPSFRVIQNHFAVSENLGDVAAKEEVWEVSAQLVGLTLGVLILDTPGLASSYPSLALIWISMRLFHLWLRYQSLSVLQFETINFKRARILARSHVLVSTVPGCVECNRQENILSWQRFLKPRIIFGASLDVVVGCQNLSSKLKTILNLYGKEKYILTVIQGERNDFQILVSFKAEATSMSVLRSIWQAYWLEENRGMQGKAMELLAESLQEMQQRFDNFIEQLEESGWDARQISLKVPREPYIEEFDDPI